MKIIKRLIFIGILGFLSLGLLGCAGDEQAEGPFTITYVDYYGEVIKVIESDGEGNYTVNGDPVIDLEEPEDKPSNVGKKYFTRWSVWESELEDINKDTTIKPVYTLDNRLITIGSTSIYFYAFFIMTGMFVALAIGVKETKRIGLEKDDLIDGFLWIVPFAIIGARLWFVINEFDEFTGTTGERILKMIGFSSGTLDFGSFGLAGLAIHGAVIVAIIGAIIYTKKKKIDLFKILDIVAIGFIIAQAFGRWGNFFNQEAHGGIVGGATNGVMNLSIQEQFNYLRYNLHLPEFIVNNMYILKGLNFSYTEPFTGYYHPTFFYESSLNIIGFGIMLVLRRWKKVHFGELLSFYLVWYGGVRLLMETMRTDPLTFELFGTTFKTPVVTSVVMIIAGILLSIYIRTKRKGMDYSQAKNPWF